MKLLSISMPHHDVNMSYYDGHQVRYIKLERTRQEKRFNFQNLLEWKREAESLWKIDVNEIDDFVFSFDPSDLPGLLRGQIKPDMLERLASGKSTGERLSSFVCDYLGVSKAWFVSHHYSHALSSWMLETSSPNVQIVIDGLGDGRPWSVYKGGNLIAAGSIKNGSIGWGIREAGKLLEIKFSHYNDIAGKVMGLQSYGRIDKGYLTYLSRFNFNQIKDIWSVDNWYSYKKDQLIGRLSHLDWVTTVHLKMGQLLVDFFKHFAEQNDTISYSGGVAQNVIWNSMLKAHFPKLLIPPHASDEGLSLGAIEWLRKVHNLPAMRIPGFPYAQSDIDVPGPSDSTIHHAAQLLAEGKIVGWYQGHGEIGPRALGNRSILMDPRIMHGKDFINKIKRREYYRPFGASVLKEHFSNYFTGASDDFMLYSAEEKSGRFPAITHIDNSCRVQLVNDNNLSFRKLLQSFFEITSCPILLNTSLNLAGKPISAFPENAMQLFFDSEIDAIIIGNHVKCK